MSVLNFRNIDKNKQLSSETRNNMYLIPTLSTQEEVLMVLNKIESSNEPDAESTIIIIYTIVFVKI